MPALVFFHGPFEAGQFADGVVPHEPGRYAYTPIEGDGHDEMQSMRRMGVPPRCHFDHEGRRTSFTVRDCPRYGQLDLIDFETLPAGSPPR